MRSEIGALRFIEGSHLNAFPATMHLLYGASCTYIVMTAVAAARRFNAAAGYGEIIPR
jgi:hypothetical protein